MVPALLTLTPRRLLNGRIACEPFPANTVLVGSTKSAPVPVPGSPSQVSVPSKVSSEPLVSSNSSQFS